MMSAFSGCVARPIYGEDGVLTWAEVKKRIAPKIYYRAPTGLVALENTHNMAGGTVYPPEVADDDLITAAKSWFEQAVVVPLAEVCAARRWLLPDLVEVLVRLGRQQEAASRAGRIERRATGCLDSACLLVARCRALCRALALTRAWHTGRHLIHHQGDPHRRDRPNRAALRPVAAPPGRQRWSARTELVRGHGGIRESTARRRWAERGRGGCRASEPCCGRGRRPGWS